MIDFRTIHKSKPASFYCKQLMGIYALHCIYTNRYYIGKAHHIPSRIKDHFEKRKNEYNNEFIKAKKLYGVYGFNVIILELTLDKSLLKELKRKWIQIFLDNNHDIYNKIRYNTKYTNMKYEK